MVTIASGQSLAQTFTAGRSGMVDPVDLWGSSVGNSYGGGTALTSLATPPTTWTANGGDQAFKAYVAPPSSVIPPPTQTGRKKAKKQRL